MKALFLRAGGLLLAASLAGCTTAGGGGHAGADVTRFHLGQPIARGQIAIEATDPADSNSIEFRGHAESVARQLTRLGWTVVDAPGRSEQIALVDVDQGSREEMRRRSPITIGIGGGTGGWGSGVGAGASFGVGGNRPREVVGTMLAVRIKRRSDGTVFWEGRASTEARADAPEAQSVVAVDRLAEALFRDFPGESGRTIRIR
jgi:hypothetical protein